MKEKILEKIRDMVANIEYGSTRDIVERALAEGVPAYNVFMDGLSKGMDIVGQKYEGGEYFLSELLGAGEIMKESMEVLKPHLQREKVEHIGRVVLGTVMGDLHDIGKNVAGMLLISAGFEVYDLGVDVQPEAFASKIRETNAEIVGISAMLTTTMPGIKNVVEELKKANLRKRVKVIIGGAPVTEEFAAEAGVDAAATDAAHGVRICRRWMSHE